MCVEGGMRGVEGGGMERFWQPLGGEGIARVASVWRGVFGGRGEGCVWREG